MKLNRKFTESAVVMVLTGAMAITSFVGNGSTKVYTEDENLIANTGLESNGIAGVAAVLNDYEMLAAEQLAGIVVVEEENVDWVASAVPTEEVQTSEESVGVVVVEGAVALSTEEQEWMNYMMPNVTASLNVRKEASADAEVVGKLYQGDRAVIVEKGSEWIKITSGNVEGYVSAEYSLTGLEAYAYAKENCDTVATSTTNGLRVRKEMSTESGVVKTIGKGESLVVDTKTEVSEGWVAVLVNKTTCYVSADFVEVEIKTGTGVTLEEERAAIAKAEAEKKAAAEKAAAAEAKKNQSNGAEKVQGPSIASSVDDVTLLAALIQCEAGGQPYECQLAVGAVVVNRMKSGSHPNTLYGVIYQRGQFGPASSGKLERRLNSSIKASCIQAAQEALSGVDNTNGAKYFKLASSGHAGVVYGAVVFY